MLLSEILWDFFQNLAQPFPLFFLAINFLAINFISVHVSNMANSYMESLTKIFFNEV